MHALEQLGGALRDEVAHLGGLAALAGEERPGRGVGASSSHRAPSRTGTRPSHPRLGRYPLGGGCGPPGVYEIRPEPLRLLHRLGAVAHAELAIQRARVLLDRVRARGTAARRSRGWSRRRRSARAPRARARTAAGRPAPRAGWKTVMPSPTIRTAPAMSAAGQSLEMKPAAPAARAAFGRDPAGAGDQQHVRSAARSRAAARRSPRPTPGRRTGRRARRAARSACVSASASSRVARAQAALDPRLLAEHQPQAPVHDLVVVDDEHAQLALARCRAAIRAGLTSGAVKRHRQSHAPGAGLALAELDDPADLQRLERGEPQAHAGRCARPPAHAVVARPRAPACRRPDVERDLDARRPACLCALRTASASTDCASGSSSRGTSTRSEPGASARSQVAGARGAAARPPRAASCCVSRRDAAERALQRAPQVDAARPAARRRSRSRASGDSSAWLENDELDAEQALDHALVDLAREVDALLQLARAAPAGWSRGARASASAAVLPSVHSRWRSLVAQRRAAGPAVGRGSRRASGPPADSGVQTSVRLAQQVAELLRAPRGDRRSRRSRSRGPPRAPGARSARTRRSRARPRTASSVDPVGARRAHAAARVVVAEDHRAVHRRRARHVASHRRL